MYDQYFHDRTVRPEFQKEFISLWKGWLGPENLHKLDRVKESEWERFNHFLALVFERYKLFIANPKQHSCKKVIYVNELMQTYEEAMTKDSSQFTRLLIPELSCVLTEDWDFTYILWHKNRVVVDALAPLIERAELHHFGPNII